MKQHRIDIRVYYEDTDAGGVVFYANYLKFCERGRTELLRDLGFENRQIAETQGLIFVVRRLEADYLAMGKLDDQLVCRTEVKEIKNASFLMRQEISRGESLIFAMNVWLVCINLEGRPTRVPDDLEAALEKE